MMRFVRKMGENSPDAIILSQADRLSACGEVITDEMVKNNISGLNRLMEFYFETGKPAITLPKLLSGNDVMELLNIPPSRMLGQILKALHEAQMSGEVNNFAEAQDFVTKIYKSFAKH